MSIVRTWNQRTPESIAMQAEKDRYGTELAFARRPQLWLIANHYKVKYDPSATKEELCAVLKEANINALEAFTLLPQLEKARAERFVRIQEEGENKVFQPAGYEDMKLFELKSLLKRRGGKPLPTMKKKDVIAALEALDGQDSSAGG